MKTPIFQKVLSLLLAVSLSSSLVTQALPLATSADTIESTAVKATDLTTISSEKETEPKSVKPANAKSDETEPDPTESSETEPEATETTPDEDQITVDVTLVNSKILTLTGEAYRLPITKDIGTQLQFRVAPKSGCKLVSVKIGSTTVIADEEDTFSVTVKEGLSICVTSTDIIAPKIDRISRNTELWSKTGAYTISVSDNIAIQSVAVTDSDGASVPVTDSGSGKYSIEVTKNDTYTVTVTDTADLTATAQFKEEKIDLTPPNISEIVRKSQSWTKQAKYSFTVSDAESGIDKVQLVNGETNTVLTPNADGLYTFTVNSNGIYTIVVTDAAGNESRKSVSEDHTDNTAPTIHSIDTQTEWDSEKNTVKIRTSDVSGIAKVEISGQEYNQEIQKDTSGIYQTELTKNGTYTVIVTDHAGNTAKKDFQIDHIDTEVPSAPVLSATNTGWTNSDVTVSAKAEDSQSGIAAYWYTNTKDPFNENTWKRMDLNGNSGSVVFSQEENSSYRVVAVDAVGRVSGESEIRVSIDKTAPDPIEIEYLKDVGFNKILNGLYIYNNKMMFSVSASDDASGVCEYAYRVVGTTAATDWLLKTADEGGFTQLLDVLEDGVYHIEIKVKDIAGNWTVPYCLKAGSDPVKFAIEATPTDAATRSEAPVISANISAGEIYTEQWTNGDVYLTVSGSAASSGIAGYEYSVDHTDPTIPDTRWAAVPYTANGYQLLIDSDTNAVYSFRAVTNAGNYSNVSNIDIRVQKTLPETVSITFDAATGSNGWYTKYPEYEIHLPKQGNFSAPVSYKISYSFNNEVQPEIIYDGQNAPLVNKDGLWSITVAAVDAAGNSATSENSTVAFNVDTVAPTQVDVLLNGESILVNNTGNASWDGSNTVDAIVFSDYSVFAKEAILIQATADGGDSGLMQIEMLQIPDNALYSVNSENWEVMQDEGIRLSRDLKYNLFFVAIDNAGNKTYFSGKSIIVDSQKPAGDTTEDLTIQVEEANRSEHGYYYDDVTLNIAVKEPVQQPYTVFSGLDTITYRILRDGAVTQSGQLYPGTGSTQAEENRIQSWSGSLVVDSARNNSNHIVVEITATDKAGNIKTTYVSDGTILIDTDLPVMASSYDNNAPVSVFDGYDAFTGSRTLTVVVTERNFSRNESSVTVTNIDSGKTLPCSWISSGNTHTATIPVSEDGRYRVSALVKDLAGNKSNTMNFDTAAKAKYQFIIDNTLPTMTVSYDNNAAKQGFYFNSARRLTVTVEERNFDPALFDVKISFTGEGGGTSNISVSGWTHSGNTHTASFLCKENGTYTVSASGMDALKNKAENISFTGTAAKYFVIDTGIEAPVFTGIENEGDYSGTITPAFTVQDKNLDEVTMKLLFTDMDGKTTDVTKEMLGAVTLSDIVNGKKAVLDVFPKAEDGIYTLSVTATDKAGNTATTEVVFSVNRNGSVYVYNAALADINGKFRRELKEDLVITEYNASGVLDDSEKVFITRDGEPLTDPIYTIDVHKQDKKWSKTVYTISWENFQADGTYKIVVSTEDAAGNFPENTDAEVAVQFSIDTTAPELTSVVGMERAICKADSISVTLTALDNVMLQSITVYLNEEVLCSWTDLDTYTEDATFTIPEGYEQHIRIVLEDKAGNTFDTDSKTFAPGYAFCREITVSSNFWLRFYADKPVFVLCIVLLIAVLAAGIFLLAKKRRSKTNR